MRKDGDSKVSVVDGCDSAKAGNEGARVAAAMPWDDLCEAIVAAYKAGQDIVVLQRFEELQAMPELDILLETQRPGGTTTATPTSTKMNGNIHEEIAAAATATGHPINADALGRVEFCWGRALLAAKRLAGDDDEHIFTIVEAFEQRFERPSEYLRVLAITADSALEVLRLHQLMEGSFSTSAVSAALHKFPSLTASETRELLEFLQANDVSLTKDLSEQLERQFVMRMKTEDAEDVFQEMCSAGVEPMSTRPYNLIFMKTLPFRHMSPVEYYLDMLDRGITPENSTFRILSKQTQNDGLVNQHFSSLAWKNSASNRRRDEDERGGTQIFFAMSLEELAKSKPDATLEEALHVFCRMDVEGTPLTNGSPVISALLTHFCRQGHLEDVERVLHLSQERGCRPTSVTVQKLLRGNHPDRFNQAEMVLQKVVEAGEVIQVECVDLLRHFVVGNIRNKAVRVFRAFVIQGHQHPNEPIPFAIASMAMKLGPFDWALGVMAILLATTDKPLGRGLQSRIRYTAHDARGREVLAVLEKCDWRHERLLSATELQEPENNSKNHSGNGGAAGATWTDPKNNQRVERSVTWLGALHVALTEMGVEPGVMEAYKNALLQAIERAKEHRGSTETS
ncbi:putative pentatricopeptide repeat domain containing protein [Trypanosoma cruzi]|nr:putative pentatricopeptide repeat domain containing protein [Trypanosoma cruzi]